MTDTVFVEFRFWLLVAASVAAPALIYAGLRTTRALGRGTVLCLGVVLVIISGVDVYLLQVLQTLAKATLSKADDAVFASEMSVALYVLPIFFGGVGVNIVSHSLIDHLVTAGTRFEAPTDTLARPLSE